MKIWHCILLLRQLNETRGRYDSDSAEHEGEDEKDRHNREGFRYSIYFFRNVPVVYPDHDLGLRVFASLLYIAALFGSQPAVVALLSYGSDKDTIVRETIIATPLLCALYRGHSIQYLGRGK
ncbi:hypothetical protein BCON_0170g00110 [Botryotinia convoluta]|uniref:Uncharacterized protein n=1 Tax=Botryotinia convoluta TaxID=54673 RepID=A0A4Z1HV99_9HELO|nr:hypothetical protein BCON_0170g00110 [Botryotinia convoluta]